MILGFYYHILVEVRDEGIAIPGFLGVFVDSLANEVEELICFFHSTSDTDLIEREYLIQSKNVRLVDLGSKGSAWSRFVNSKRYLSGIESEVLKCDQLLVRAPSPLSPSFYFRFKNNTIVNFLLVGDYVLSGKEARLPMIKKNLLRLFYFFYQRRQNQAVSCSKVLVNSGLLFERNKRIARSIHEVKTTTLSRRDFFHRKDSCEGNTIKLLYTGRFDWAKGFKELIEALAQVQNKNVDLRLELHFVGWQHGGKTDVQKGVLELARSFEVSDKVFFHGKKKIGAELNAMYRMADIYVIPSYAEGFPRTIWEAMANGCPVISTNVGSIPVYLEDGKNALLINPRKPTELFDAVNKLIENGDLRRSIISSAFELAKTNTLEYQSKKIIDLLSDV